MTTPGPAVDPARSATMRAVKARDTAPEIAVRRMLTGLGLRYRLHRADLPGSPDIAFIGRRVALFVHGCFWHGHDCRRGARAPKTNADYWRAKIDRNRARDAANTQRLAEIGWRELVLWECELRDPPALRARLEAALLSGARVDASAFFETPPAEAPQEDECSGMHDSLSSGRAETISESTLESICEVPPYSSC